MQVPQIWSRLVVAIVALSLAIPVRADPPKEELTPKQRKDMEEEAKFDFAMSMMLSRRGNSAAAVDLLEKALAIEERLYPPDKYPDGHADLASCLTNLASALQDIGARDKALPYYRRALAMKERLYPPAKYPDGHPGIAASLNNLGVLLDEMGDHAGALPYFQRALAMLLKLFPPDKYPDGHSRIATSLSNIAFVFRGLGELEKSKGYYEQAVSMGRKLHPPDKFPDGDPDLAISLNSLGDLLEYMGNPEAARPYFAEALAMRKKLYPPDKFPQGHFELAESLHNMGHVLVAMGGYDEARPYYDQALAMDRKLHPVDREPDGHPDLITSLHNVGLLLQATGDFDKARECFEQALNMAQKLYPKDKYPQGHANLAASLNNLGGLCRSTGDYEKALAYLEQALAMRRTLYPARRFPNGHVALAQSLSNVGVVLCEMDAEDKALPYYEQAVQMYRALYPVAKYPDGQADLAISLNNLGFLQMARGDFRGALTDFEQALAMRRRLYPADKYPNGHPSLAINLNNVGTVWQHIGDYEKALPYMEQALAMLRKINARDNYTSGHPDIAGALSNMGHLRQMMGDRMGALEYLQQALSMYQAHVQQQAAFAPEADALSLVAALPQSCSAYLSVALHVPGTDAASYDQVWQSKAALTRVLEQRHTEARIALAHVATGGGLFRQWQELTAVRREIARLALDQSLDAAARDRRLAELTDTRDRLERELARKLPDLALRTERDRHTAADLIRALPAGTAFIDILRFTRFEQDPKVPGRKGERRTDCYCAFILRPGQPVLRVDLGEAKPIDDAVSEWCRIVRGSSNPDGSEIKRLVWEPLAAHLGPDTTAVYISPDGELSRLPWAALPGSKDGTVLLEEYALAIVPHGPFLLEQLLHPPAAADPNGEVLTLGGVSYGAQRPGTGLTKYVPLPGTSREQTRVKSLAGNRPVTPLAGSTATAAHLLEELSKARFAHLATHGFFDETALRQEHQRQRAELDRLRRGASLMEGHGLARAGVGTRSPLAYTGLALAGANDSATAGPEGGIVTGEQLVQLPLEHLQLAVLSACETGLGELTGGEGVQGLVRAFHLAGCPTVIASLWSIDDDATAALMTVFYDGLWNKGQSPREALRRAQLAIYHHPELIRALAGDNDDARAAALSQVDHPPAGDRLAKVRQWAAFVLSGTGQ